MAVKFESVNVARMDGSQVQRELEKLQQANVRLTEKLHAVSNAGDQAGKIGAKSFMQLQRAADGLARSLDGPQQKLQRQLATLQEAQAKGVKKAGGEDIGEAIAKVKRQIQETDAATMKAVARFEQLKGVVSKAMAESISPTQRLRQEVKLLEEAKRRGLGPERQLQAAIDRTKQKIRETSPAYQERIRNEQELKRFSQDVARSIVSDSERQAAHIKKLAAAHHAGLLTAKQYEAALKSATARSNVLQQTGGAAVNKIKTGLLGLGTATFGITALISNLTKALDEAKELDAQFARRQIDVSQAQAAAVKNLGAVSTDEASGFLRNVQGIQKDTNFSELKDLYMAASDTLSATGGNQQLTLEILKQATPLFKDAPDQLATFAGAVADISTIKGASSAEEIKGVISTVLSAQGQARITDLGAFKEAAAAIAGATVTDTSGDKDRAIREAAAAFAAIGGSIKDPEGALTKTAVSNLASQLERLLPEKDIMKPVSEAERADLEARRAGLVAKIEDLQTAEPPKGKQFTDAEREKMAAQVAQAQQQIVTIDQNLAGVARKGTGLKTYGERIAAVQQSEELQRLFFEGDSQQGVSAASFRGPITPVIKQMLTDAESEAAKRFGDALLAVTDDPATYNQLVKNVKEASPQLQLAEFSQEAETIKVAAETEGVDEAIRAKVREITEQTLSATKRGTGFVDTFNNLPLIGEMANFDIETRGRDRDTFDAAQRILLTRRQQITEGGGLVSSVARSMSSEDIQAGVDRLGSQQDREAIAKLTPEEQAKIQRLDATIMLLERKQESLAVAQAAGADVGENVQAAQAFRTREKLPDAAIQRPADGMQANQAGSMSALINSPNQTVDLSTLTTATERQTRVLETIAERVSAPMQSKPTGSASVAAAATMSAGRLGR